MPKQKRSELTKATAYIYKVRKIFKGAPHNYREFIKIMRAFKANEISCLQVLPLIEKLFKDHPELISGFRQFMPSDNLNPTSQSSKPKQTKRKFECLLVKPTKEELEREYSEIILRDRKHLMADFNSSQQFQPHLTSSANKPTLLKADTKRGREFLATMAAVKTAILYPRDYAFILKAINLFNIGIVGAGQLVRIVEPKFKLSSELSFHFLDFCSFFNVPVPSARSSVASINSSKRPRPTPSYVSVTDEEQIKEQERLHKFMLPEMTHIVKVLNTRTLLAERGRGPVPESARTGSSPGKAPTASGSEKLRWEIVCQDLTDQEEIIDTINICLQQTRSLLQTLRAQRNVLGDAKIAEIFDSLSKVQIGCLKRLYDRGNILQAMRLWIKSENPTILLDHIDHRLQRTIANVEVLRKQQLGQLNKFRAEHEWKILDIQGPKFKSKDRKNVTRLLVREAIEGPRIVDGSNPQELHKHDPRVLSSTISPTSHSGHYNYSLRLEYPEPDIHEHLFNLVSWVIMDGNDKPDNDDQREAVKLWTGFLHSFFGINLEYEVSKVNLGEDVEKNKESKEVTWSLNPPILKDDNLSKICSHSRLSRLVISNRSIYTLFRLHHRLYNRLRLAKALTVQQRDVPESKVRKFLKQKCIDDKVREELPLDHQVHLSFYKWTYENLENEMSRENYEENLHRLLGPQSYPLTTLKFLLRTIAQLSLHIAKDPECNRIRALHNWQNSGVDPKPTVGGTNYTRWVARYYKRVLEQAKFSIKPPGSGNDASVRRFHIEFFPDSKELGIASLSLSNS